jgi:hypothetical protein
LVLPLQIEMRINGEERWFRSETGTVDPVTT